MYIKREVPTVVDEVGAGRESTEVESRVSANTPSFAFPKLPLSGSQIFTHSLGGVVLSSFLTSNLPSAEKTFDMGLFELFKAGGNGTF